jgi:hypothetical protein
MGRAGAAGIAVAAAASLLHGCDGSFSFRSRPDGAPADGSAGGATVSGRFLSMEPPPGGEVSTRPSGEVLLRFDREVDAESARDALRVEEERGRVPVPVETEARGREIAVRPRDAEGWRPGATLSLRVAGMPSLRALRAADGSSLQADASLRVRVRSARRADRVPPSLLSSDPADGAVDVDPSVPVTLVFSEPMDARALDWDARSARPAPLRLSADGGEVPFRCFLDRARRVLTVLPEVAFAPGAAVTLEIGGRTRDQAGNPLAAEPPREVYFRVAAAAPAAPSPGRVVEAFEDRDLMDPLGTTVRWNDPAERGVLSGVLETAVLAAGAEGEPGALLLDPRGGSFRVLVPAAELGDEPRTLKGLQLPAAPGSVSGEILEPRVRVASVTPLLQWPEEPGAAWREATEGLRGAIERGADGAFPVPFRHPVPLAGGEALLVEVSWTGVAGSVILRAARHPETRCLLSGASADPRPMRTAPVLRLESVGRSAVARSRWIDSGAASPSWQEPRARPAGDAGRVRILLQGAPPATDRDGPDSGRASPWTADPSALEGMRWVRFRVVFEEPGTASPPAALDDLTIPFLAR